MKNITSEQINARMNYIFGMIFVIAGMMLFADQVLSKSVLSFPDANLFIMPSLLGISMLVSAGTKILFRILFAVLILGFYLLLIYLLGWRIF